MTTDATAEYAAELQRLKARITQLEEALDETEDRLNATGQQLDEALEQAADLLEQVAQLQHEVTNLNQLVEDQVRDLDTATRVLAELDGTQCAEQQSAYAAAPCGTCLTCVQEDRDLAVADLTALTELGDQVLTDFDRWHEDLERALGSPVDQHAHWPALAAFRLRISLVLETR